MKQSLRMSQSQRLAMTAQMRQAIHILQMSAQDLQTAVEKEYMENPVLEMDEEIPDEGGRLPSGSFREDGREFEAAAPADVTLEEDLLEQAAIAFSDEREREIAAFIIGSLDERGYLTIPVEGLMDFLKADEAEILEVLRRIQTFEPWGVGARDLQECLRIQAEQRGICYGLVEGLIERHLDAVAEARIKDIAAEEKVTPKEVQAAVDVLRTLNPKPGSAYGSADRTYIVPDVLVVKTEDGYKVRLHEGRVSRFHISQSYLKENVLEEAEKQYIHQHLQSAKWLLYCIEQRKKTLCRVMEAVLRLQRDCVEKGMAYLAPMTMKQVAEEIGVHESTVSRTAANKYVGFPWGTVPLRKLFATVGSRLSEEDFLAGQAKAAMERLIKEEDPKKPLSDQNLTKLLEEQGINLSRRTVMKYREQMGIPSSVKRKRY